MAGLSPNWAEADAHAGLGLPLRPGVRLRLLRRVLAKLASPFFSQQIAVNRALLGELDAVRQRIDQADQRLDRLGGDLEHHSAVLVRHEEPLDRHEFLLKALEPAIGDLLRQIDLVSDKVDLGQRQALARLYDVVGPIRTEIAQLEERRRVTQLEAQDLALLLNQVDLFLTEVKKSLPGPPSPERLAQIATGSESLTPVVAEAFRGAVAVVKERVRIYVGDLAALGEGGPVLDIGCGRGELLEELNAAGVSAYGIDLDPKSVEKCLARGLDVRREEARSHLQGLEPGSLNAVTAIHVVEHLETDDLIELIELAARAIRHGGLLIFETPNPENLIIASSSFYLDPTHKRPLPPALLSFLVGLRGFDEVEVRRLERAEQASPLPGPKPDEPWAEVLGAVVGVLNYHLFGPADYAVLARRP